MKHRWRYEGKKGDSVWWHHTWRCARCGTKTTLTGAAGESEAKLRPRRGKTGVPDCQTAIVEQVHRS